MAHFPSFTRLRAEKTQSSQVSQPDKVTPGHISNICKSIQESYLCIVKLQMGEFEVLKDLDVCVPNQEIAVLLSPALLERPVLTTLDTPPFHHPNTTTKLHSIGPMPSHYHTAVYFIAPDRVA